jgi:hypothetical protein
MEPAIQTRIQTDAVRVVVTTDDYEIDGYMHVKPGGYLSRISDLLNSRDLHFVPITQATYRNLHSDDQPCRAGTLILRLDTIKMVVPQDENSCKSANGDSSRRGGNGGASL